MENLTLRKVRYEGELYSDSEITEIPPEWKEIIVEAFKRSEYREVLSSPDVKNNLGKSYPTYQKVICDRYNCYYEDKHFEMGLDCFNFEKMYLPGKLGSFGVRLGREYRKRHLPVYKVITEKFIDLIAPDI